MHGRRRELHIAPTADAFELEAAMSDAPGRLIAALGLAPHPEGGHYRETFRDAPGPDGRAASTAILFLLKAGEVSRWHRVDAVEIWHWHGGDALELTLAAADGARSVFRLGGDIEAGQTPQVVVPAHAWQTARPLGAYALVGCTVTPGFDFAGFELAAEGFEPQALHPTTPPVSSAGETP